MLTSPSPLKKLLVIMTTLVSYHESTVVVNEAVLGEVPPILRKADPRNYKDHRMVDAKGNTVLTEKYLKQLCREQGGYQTAELNDKLFLHFKGKRARFRDSV